MIGTVCQLKDLKPALKAAETEEQKIKIAAVINKLAENCQTVSHHMVITL
jgi:hypothetical protein